MEGKLCSTVNLTEIEERNGQLPLNVGDTVLIQIMQIIYHFKVGTDCLVFNEL